VLGIKHDLKFPSFLIFSNHHVQTGSGSHPASYPVGSGDFPWRWNGRGVKLITHLHLVSRLKMRGAYKDYVFMAWYLVKHRDYFTVPWYLGGGTEYNHENLSESEWLTLLLTNWLSSSDREKNTFFSRNAQSERFMGRSCLSAHKFHIRHCWSDFDIYTKSCQSNLFLFHIGQIQTDQTLHETQLQLHGSSHKCSTCIELCLTYSADPSDIHSYHGERFSMKWIFN
jgi:hypothetical protein